MHLLFWERSPPPFPSDPALLADVIIQLKLMMTRINRLSNYVLVSISYRALEVHGSLSLFSEHHR